MALHAARPRKQRDGYLLWQRAFRQPYVVDGSYWKLLHVPLIHLHCATTCVRYGNVDSVQETNTSGHYGRVTSSVNFKHIAVMQAIP